jgi:hypothetical protein
MAKKMGRPTINPKGPLGRVLQIRLTDEEREAYQKAAEKAGEPISAWIRDQLAKAAKRAARQN